MQQKPGFLHPFSGKDQGPPFIAFQKKSAMFSNQFKIAWRNLIKDGQFTLLNLLGLATGLACAFLIYLWIDDELHVDRFNQNEDRLYQVLQNSKSPSGIQTTENTPGLLAKSLAEEMPEVEYASSVIPVSWFDKKGILTYGDNHATANAQFVGRDYLRIFSYPLLKGAKQEPLEDQNSILISEDLAVKLFHTKENIVGKTLNWNQKDFSGPYQIAGIFQNPPGHSTNSFDILFNYDLFLAKNPKLADWENSQPSTYLLLRKGSRVDLFNQKIEGFKRSKSENAQETFFVQKFSDKYLHNHYENGVPSGGRIEYIRLFSFIGLFILIMASINFMNLSTAKAERRMKEAGIRKVMGAARISLVMQYLGESLLMAFLSLILAVGIVFLLLDRFNEITGKQIGLHLGANLILPMVSITLLTGLLSGTYPALFLSGFKPVAILKGRLKKTTGDLLIRKALVIFQFTISAIFIISVLVIHRQMKLVQTKNLGYNRDHIIYFEKEGMISDNPEDYAPGGKYETSLENFLDRVRAVPGVIQAANFRHNITNRNGGTYDLSWPGEKRGTRIDFTDLGVGYQFMETMGIELKEGRAFSRAHGSEKSKIIFNELAMNRMGLKDPIGKTIHLWGEDRQIIGVVKNFNFQSLYENMKPCFFDLSLNQRASKVAVRIQPRMERETIARLQKIFQEECPGFAFEYRFLEADYQALYSAEERVAALSNYFSGLAMLISCLCLFGLSAFTARKRQREIGIRKVAGAKAIHVFTLLSRDFLKLTWISLLIAFPISFWWMSEWLHAFAYRVSLKWDVFLLTGISIGIMTLFSIGFQTLRAALTNPIKCLRTE
jgi:putative ABC transport system permease protein